MFWSFLTTAIHGWTSNIVECIVHTIITAIEIIAIETWTIWRVRGSQKTRRRQYQLITSIDLSHAMCDRSDVSGDFASIVLSQPNGPRGPSFIHKKSFHSISFREGF